MAHEACVGTGANRWKNSVLVSTRTGNVQRDGTLQVDVIDVASGTLRGTHDDSGEELNGICTPGGQFSFISLSRRKGAGSLMYSGLSVLVGGKHVIVRGTYVEFTATVNSANEETLVASDNGDWTAEKPGD